MTKSSDLEGTKRLMAALGRMPPKQHKDMKLGKIGEKENASRKPKQKKRKG